jgi:hypothetical protein
MVQYTSAEGILFLALWDEKKKKFVPESFWSESDIIVASLVVSLNKLRAAV